MHPVMAEVCEGIEWNPVAVAPSHSALAAVIAGFVFTGAVLVLSDRGPAGYHPRSLTLLMSSFFVLVLDSFIFSVIGGEQACHRAWSEMMIGAGLLGIGTLGVFSGIAWLSVDSDRRYASATSYLTTVARWTAPIIAVQLLITGLFYLGDVYRPGRPPIWLTVAAWVFPAAIAIAVPVVTVLQRTGRWVPGSRSIAVAVYSSTGYAVVSALSFGILGNSWVDPAPPPPTWVAAVAVTLALALSAVAVVAHLLALPPAPVPPQPEPPAVPAAREPATR